MSTKVSTDLIDLSSNTGGLVWAKGPTTGQPASATAGEMRVDTTTATTVVYTGTQWKTLKETAFVVPPIPTHFLVVAGGGGGGSHTGGGGGAGGLRTSYGSTTGGGGSAESTTGISLNTAYTITVGAGGAGGPANAHGNKGINSLFSNITSEGGGYGGGIGSTEGPAGDGGSGGGAGVGTPSAPSSLPGGNAQTSPVQGYNGGAGGTYASPYPGGGGGGAGVIGANAYASGGGDGGNGLSSSITGSSVIYAGGGGGSGSHSGGTPGSGGTGGGGAGGDQAAGENATFNTGSGGGGGGNSNLGGSGGSGVVILRYPTADLPYFTTTGTLNTPSATDTVADAAYPVTNTAYYKLDNNANDSGLGSGYIGQGGIFNGNGEIDTGIDLDTYDETWSISLWVKFIFNSSYRYIAGDLSASGALNGFTIDTSPTGQIRFRFRNSTASVASITSTNTYGDGDWHHIAAVKDSSNNYLYVDGVQVGTVATVNGISHTTNIILGRVGAYNGFYNGTLDQVRIFPTSLSSSNVSLLYAETSATSSTLNYPVTATALYELSGNANDTGNTYNGTATNVLYAFNGTATNVTYGNGRFNEAANFNGSSSRILLPSNLISGTTDSDYSVSMWVKFNTLPTSNFISLIGSNSNISVFRLLLYYNSGSTYNVGVLRTFGGSYYYNSVNTGIQATLSTGQYYNIIVTYQSSNKLVNGYLNGNPIGSYTLNLSASGTAGAPILGSYNGSTLYNLNGSLDQMRIFSSALAAGDIQDLYNEHFQTKFTDGSDTALMFTGGTGDITFLDTDPNVAVDYLVVAGGGGGGGAGGAGAGGLLTTYATTPSTSSGNQSQLTLNTSDTYTIIVGTGGAGSGTAYAPIGTVGVNSSISGSFTGSPITAAGGGAGGASSGSNGGDGGSGGGAGWSTSGGTATPSGQGFDGGSGIAAPNYSGGGGGGASETPITPTQSVAGAGGEGVTVSITGSAVGYAGGGGAAGYATAIGSGAAPAVGGGGAGRNWGGSTGSAPTPNPGTDGKGGGGGSGGDGGDGVVILRYPNTKTITVGAGLTATTAAVGTDSVTTFTAGTGTITFS